MVELPPLEVFRRCEDVAFREWFTPGFSSVRLMVGLVLTRCFQP